MPTPTTSPLQVTYGFNTIDVPGSNGFTEITAVNDKGDLAGAGPLPVPSALPGDSAFIDVNGTFTLFQPGESSLPVGINNHDVVVGLSSAHSVPITTGWTYSNGIITTVVKDGGTFTSVNNSGESVGYFTRFAHGSDDGFTYQNGVVTLLDVPGAVGTRPMAINDKGDVAGSFFSSFFFHGFLDQGGHFLEIDYPGASSTGVVGLNSKDEVVGNYDNLINGVVSSQGVFTFQNGHYTNIVVPNAINVEAVAINNQDVVVGNFRDSSFHEHGFVNQNGQTITLDAPGATDTFITGINNHGEIVGSFHDATGTHGFTATPGGSGVTHTTFDFSSVSATTFAPPASGTMLTDTSASGGSAGLSMSTSLVDPSLLVTPHIPT